MLGVLAAKRFDWSAALNYDTIAINLQPDDPDACIELAKVLSRDDDSEKAQHLIEHALKIDPTYQLGHYRLSRIYKKQGKIQDSDREFAEFRKYKQMNDQLRTIFKDMRMNAGKNEKDEDTDEPK